MIIVSQDKTVIINFDNASDIHIDNKDTNRKIWATSSSISYLLGEYATEERAKEVLIKIGSAYTTMKVINARNFYPTEALNGDTLVPYIAFEMPLE